MCPTDETLEEIDAAIQFAIETRKNVIDSKKPAIDEFINDLLDTRLELKK